MPPRDRSDRCPGVCRPWPADDGLLVRLRLIGGRISSRELTRLAAVGERYGDGRVHLTGRANLQLRALPGQDGALRREVVTALEETGLLPSRSHELVRNVMVSPQTGLAGGRADLRPVATRLDELLCADPRLASLPGRFLFVLDDGRGDLVERGCDLGLVALDAERAQLRAGDSWGAVVPLDGAASAMAELAREFLAMRGEGPSAPWHVAELPGGLIAPEAPDPALPRPAEPLPYGPVGGGNHVAAPDGVLDRGAVDTLVNGATELIVTPWRGVLIPEATR